MLKNKFALGVIAALAVVVTLGAVNGVFNSVNSTTGYQISGGTTVSASHFALCSIAGSTKFDGACPMSLYGSGAPAATCAFANVNQEYVDTTTYSYWYCKAIVGPSFVWTGPFGGTPFYQTVTGHPQEPALTFSGEFTVTDSAGTSTNIALAHHTDHLVATGLCTTTSGTYHTCSSGPYSWAEGGFSGTSYAVTCQVVNPSSSAGANSGFVYPIKTSTTLSLTLQSNAGETFTATEIDCIGRQ